MTAPTIAPARTYAGALMSIGVVVAFIVGAVAIIGVVR